MNNHEAFWEYVHHLTPPERKRLQIAWHSDVQQLERVHPALLNWTKQYRLARLISIGLFSEHSVEGTQTLVSLAGLDIHPREFEGVLEYRLDIPKSICTAPLGKRIFCSSGVQRWSLNPV